MELKRCDCNVRSFGQLTNSEVLADVPVTGAKEFQFPDAELECRAVVEQFLELATYNTLDTNTLSRTDDMGDTRTLVVLLNLSIFLDKYDCESLVGRLQAAVVRLLPTMLWGWQGFILGALWRNDDICSGSLEVPATPADWGCTVQNLKMKHVEQYDMWELVEPRYGYALRWVEFEIERYSTTPRTAVFRKALKQHDSAPKEDWNWRFGDVTFISSDRWTFRVSSETLLSAGFSANSQSFFRFKLGYDRLDRFACWPERLTFTDLATGRKAVVEQFLNLAVHSCLLTPRGSSHWHDCQELQEADVRLYQDTLHFLQRHGCSRLISTFCAQIGLLMTYRIVTPPIGFAFGTLAGNKDLYAASLTYYHPSQGPFRGEKALPSFLPWNHHSWSLRALQRVKDFADGAVTFSGYSTRFDESFPFHFRDTRGSGHVTAEGMGEEAAEGRQSAEELCQLPSNPTLPDVS